MALANFFSAFWSNLTSATRTTFSPIFRLRLRRRKRAPTDSLFLLSRVELAQLQALLSDSQEALPLLRRLLEDQAEIETGALLRAASTDEVHFLRGRITALLDLANLPQRVALANKEYHDRAERERAQRDLDPDLTPFWGSPNFTDVWRRRPADRRSL